MTLLQAILLGVIQGLTEFLPVSSSGHLILFPAVLNLTIQDISFDVMLHLGTALAVLVYFYKDWQTMILSLMKDSRTYSTNRNHKFSTDSHLLIKIIIITIPVGLIGALLENTVETYFRNPVIVAIQIILISFVIFFAQEYNKKLKDRTKLLEQIPFLKALTISLSQVIALIPGTSRSGISISTGLFLKLDKTLAAKFSFLLSTPVIVGAAIYKLKDIASLDEPAVILVSGFLCSFIVGILTIKSFLSFISRFDLNIFIIYRIILGLVILFLFLK